MWIRPYVTGSAPAPRSAHTAVTHDKKLFVFGGHGGGSSFNDVAVLDTVGMSWFQPKVTGFVPDARENHTANIVGPKMIIFGGSRNNYYYSDVFVLDTVNFVWTRPKVRGTPPEPRDGHSSCLHEGVLYIYGGQGTSPDGSTVKYDDVYMLDLSTFTWAKPRIAGARPQGRDQHSAIVYKNKMVVFGGRDEKGPLDDINILNLEACCWEDVNPKGSPPSPRHGFSSSQAGPEILYFGGWSPQGYCNDVTVYNIETSTWSKPFIAGKSPRARANHTSTLVGKQLVVFGGWGGVYLGGGIRLNDVYILDFSKADQAEKATPVPESPKDVMSLKDFDMRDILGAGSFGKVYLTQHKHTGKFYAMKTMSKSAIIKLKQVQHVKSEKQMLINLNHPFMVNMFGAFQDDKYLYLLMEYVRGGEVFSHLRKQQTFSNQLSQLYAAEIVLALEYLHSQNIAYRDLKPENLLIDHTGHVKVTDFGFAKTLEDNRTWTLCGTPEYLAPEIIQGKGYGTAVDWWAVGILIYEMLAGYPPFYHEEPLQMYQKILAGKFDFPRNFDKNAKDLVKRLLVQNPTKRIGCAKAGAEDIKQHKWFKGLDWNQVYNKKIPSPFVPKTAGEGDTSNFDKYPIPKENLRDLTPQEQAVFRDF